MCAQVKAVLVGDSGVGKTSIYQRLEHNIFNVAQMPTVGGSFAKIRVPIGSVEREIGLWDTAGQERFRTIVPLYFQRASLVLIVYSVGSRESYDNLQTWFELAKSHAPPEVHFFVIGNKADLIDERQVNFDEAQGYSDKIGADVYIETSAVTGAGCEDLLAAFGRYLESLAGEREEAFGAQPASVGGATASVGLGPSRAEGAASGCC
jgi:small GTP-binding protein